MGQGLAKEQDGCGQRQQNEQGDEQSKKGQMAPNGFFQPFVETNEDLGHPQASEHGNDQGVIQQQLHQTIVGCMLGHESQWIEHQRIECTYGQSGIGRKTVG